MKQYLTHRTAQTDTNIFKRKHKHMRAASARILTKLIITNNIWAPCIDEDEK